MSCTTTFTEPRTVASPEADSGRAIRFVRPCVKSVVAAAVHARRGTGRQPRSLDALRLVLDRSRAHLSVAPRSRRGDRAARLGTRLAAVHDAASTSGRFAVRRGHLLARCRLDVHIPRAHRTHCSDGARDDGSGQGDHRHTPGDTVDGAVCLEAEARRPRMFCPDRLAGRSLLLVLLALLLVLLLRHGDAPPSA